MVSRILCIMRHGRYVVIRTSTFWSDKPELPLGLKVNDSPP
jgi:uncharacterized protein (TIGR02117 family)